ncbi:MAG: integrin [Myxococcota bacterium]
MERRWAMVRILGGLLGIGLAGCFRGDFLEGDPCESNADCGPRLTCEDRICGGLVEPRVPDLTLDPVAVKQFRFTWTSRPEVESYKLFERLGPEQSRELLRGDIPVEREFVSVAMPLYSRLDASYELTACNVLGCTDSAPVDASVSMLATAIGYFKASNTDASDYFGASLVLSEDGSTLAIGAPAEDSDTTSVNGPDSNNDEDESGAVYVFVRADNGRWSQQAYLKANNAESPDSFGASVAMNDDGNTLVVGAPKKSEFEFGDGPSGGPSGGPGGGSGPDGFAYGAAYVFVRDDDGRWSQQSNLEASNASPLHFFGTSVALSADGNTLAVGAPGDSSDTTGIDGPPNNSSSSIAAGAVYVFVRDKTNDWHQEAYVKTSSTDALQLFGWHVALNRDGNTLAVGAPGERSNATGIDGDQADRSLLDAGAAYVFVRDSTRAWSAQAYIKSPQPRSYDWFGSCLALDASGDTLAVGAPGTGREVPIPDDALPEDLAGRGTVYLYARDDSSAWSHQTELRPSTTDPNDSFGGSVVPEFEDATNPEAEFSAATMVALSDDGKTLAVGAMFEDGSAKGFEGDPADNSEPNSGAVYLFLRDDENTWSHHAYIKAPNADTNDYFGSSVALSGDGNTLGVGAVGEDSRAAGTNGNPTDPNNDNAEDAGAVYLY